MKITYNILLKYLLKLHNLSYYLINVVLSRAEKVHPKHHLMNYHKFFVDNVCKNDTVLDIGCGKGEVAFDVAKKARSVLGIDLNKEYLEFAQKNCSSQNINYVYGDATKDLPEQKFDVIILSNVLEHIEKRIDFLNKIKKLAPKILIRVPMIDRAWTVLYKKEMGVEWRYDLTHYTEYTLESFKEEIKQAGLKIKNYSVQFGEIWGIVEI